MSPGITHTSGTSETDSRRDKEFPRLVTTWVAFDLQGIKFCNFNISDLFFVVQFCYYHYKVQNDLKINMFGRTDKVAQFLDLLSPMEKQAIDKSTVFYFWL